MVGSTFSQQVRARLGPPTLVKEEARGVLSAWVFAEEAVVLQQVKGHVSTTLVEQSVQLCDRAVSEARAPLLLMDDLANVTSYDSAARVRSIEWSKLNQDKLASVHVLFHSKLIAMAVSVANLALRDPMHSYSAREPFEQQILEALGPRRRV
jgi:hypothetical protein